MIRSGTYQYDQRMYKNYNIKKCRENIDKLELKLL